MTYRQTIFPYGKEKNNQEGETETLARYKKRKTNKTQHLSVMINVTVNERDSRKAVDLFDTLKSCSPSFFFGMCP